MSAFLANISGSSVSSEFKFLDARNLICLQPLPNTLYTNCYNLKHRSFRSVWTQKRNKSRCIFGAFIVPLKSLKRIQLKKVENSSEHLKTICVNIIKSLKLKRSRWDQLDYLKFIRHSPIFRSFAPILTQPVHHTTRLDNICHHCYNSL